jgi:hypothetical protein
VVQGSAIALYPQPPLLTLLVLLSCRFAAAADDFRAALAFDPSAKVLTPPPPAGTVNLTPRCVKLRSWKHIQRECVGVEGNCFPQFLYRRKRPAGALLRHLYAPMGAA